MEQTQPAASLTRLAAAPLTHVAALQVGRLQMCVCVCLRLCDTDKVCVYHWVPVCVVCVGVCACVIAVLCVSAPAAERCCLEAAGKPQGQGLHLVIKLPNVGKLLLQLEAASNQ